MSDSEIPMAEAKNIAVVAHDKMKDDLVEWGTKHRAELLKHNLFATGTTGTIMAEALDLDITRLQSGPLGGDQQVGAKIAENEIDFLIFFWDPFSAQPHEPDVRALLRLAVVWNIPVATNRASADFMISSPLISQPYVRKLVDVNDYRNRFKT